MNNIFYFLISLCISFVSIVCASEEDGQEKTQESSSFPLVEVKIRGLSEFENPKGSNILTQIYAKGPTGSFPAYLLCSSKVMADLIGSNPTDSSQVDEDPAIRFYTSKAKDVDIELLLSKQELSDQNDILLRANTLDLSNRNLVSFSFLYVADLSCIRNINISCSAENKNAFDANTFLSNLFRQNRNLRSIEIININNTNISTETIELWRQEVSFDKSLIRDKEKINQCNGWKIASICFDNTHTTPVINASMTIKRNLQRSSQRKLPILYRDQEYEEGEAHLQIFLK